MHKKEADMGNRCWKPPFYFQIISEKQNKNKARKPIEHFIHSTHHNFEIYHDFKSIRLASKFDRYNESWNTLVTASDDVVDIKTERYDYTVIKLLLTVKNGYYQ